MIRRLLIVAILFVSPNCFSGVESQLLSTELNGCKIDISHSAAPGASSGTVLFSSYKVIDGIHWACEITKNAVTQSLKEGISILNTSDNLVPVSSIRIGHIRHYKWALESFKEQSTKEKRDHISNREFGFLVASEVFSAPFSSALKANGFNLKGADCEKVSFYSNGAPEDGFCWLIIERR